LPYSWRVIANSSIACAAKIPAKTILAVFLARHHATSVSSKALASFRSSVSKPSMNQS
jgi:hypothetical protein